MTTSFTTVATNNILLIGSGRLARHLHSWYSFLPEHYFKGPKPNLFHWDRKKTIQELDLTLKKTTFVWLAIKDDAIVPFYTKELEHLLQRHHKVVHFSGTIHDGRMKCAHPLMTFSDHIYTLTEYQKIHFALTGVQKLDEIMPGFNNQFFQIKPEDKALYHALCVCAGNLPQLIWNEVYQQAKGLSIPPAALHAYIQKSAENFSKLGAQALTGPIVRQDQSTIQSNLNALDGSFLKVIYQSFLNNKKAGS